ncbi:unnamed protein product [Closterium sp. NIES-65]|nr:unnamed protein product [Closterium sp. NIES-65]
MWLGSFSCLTVCSYHDPLASLSPLHGQGDGQASTPGLVSPSDQPADLEHHAWSTMPGAPHLEQHARSTTPGAPRLEHHAWSTTPGAARKEHHAWSTTPSTTPGAARTESNGSTGTPQVKAWRKTGRAAEGTWLRAVECVVNNIHCLLLQDKSWHVNTLSHPQPLIHSLLLSLLTPLFKFLSSLSLSILPPLSPALKGGTDGNGSEWTGTVHVRVGRRGDGGKGGGGVHVCVCVCAWLGVFLSAFKLWSVADCSSLAA